MMNEMQLYDIYGHWHEPFWQTTWFKMLSCFIFIGLILAVIWWYFNYYYKPKEVSIQIKVLNALEMLEKKPIHTKEDAQAHYFALTALLKTFFEHTYATPFTGMSDIQMIDALCTTQFPHHLMPALEKMVEASVYVKYAQHDALQPELLHHIAQAKDIVQKII